MQRLPYQGILMRESRKLRLFEAVGIGLTLLLAALCMFWPRSLANAEKAQITGMPSPAQMNQFEHEFDQQIWPILQKKCAKCHTGVNPSHLRLTEAAATTFQILLANGHLDPSNSSSLLARVSSKEDGSRMPPPPSSPLSPEQINTLSKFCTTLYSKMSEQNGDTGLHFPAALLLPYRGPVPHDTGDNTFLTYYQLKNKIETIFGDKWERDNKNMFEVNLAQFGGADFIHSFNERTHPNAEYLSALDSLSNDAASNAFLNQSGPFQGFDAKLSAPSISSPPTAYKHNIDLLYQRLLFRPPTPAEVVQSYHFLQAIYRDGSKVGMQDGNIQFQLTVQDSEGNSGVKQLSIATVNDSFGLQQTLINENDTTARTPDKKIAYHLLEGVYTLKSGDAGQQLVVSNKDTSGTVEVAGVGIIGPLPSTSEQDIDINSTGIRVEGAWNKTEDNGVAAYDDNPDSKGGSVLTFPLNVLQNGKYRLTLRWRNRPFRTNILNGKTFYEGNMADDLIASVRSHNLSTTAEIPAPIIPPAGQADYNVDEKDDTHAFRQLGASFQFGSADGIVISNTNTKDRVVADAIRLTSRENSDSTPFYINAQQAEGYKEWPAYKKDEYSFYKPIGAPVSDNNDAKLKGKLSLLYRPSAEKEFKPNVFYKVAFGYPGQVNNASNVPLVVHALASTPIVRVETPVLAYSGSRVVMDASGSYNVQHASLSFHWKQIGGPRVVLINSNSDAPSFVTPLLTVKQAAWEGLCRALMHHPDFLFTRPLSLAFTTNPEIRRQLQLVKIAQDLVARPPTQDEISELDHGKPLSYFVDRYLNSNEFNKFYFRRIRLYLESHGSTSDDEPVRLWTWIMENNKPFSQILTADYTVTPDWKTAPRPAYCGHSGVLTMKGFVDGKPGLPHFNYAAQVLEKFMGFVFVVPEAIVKMREGVTAVETTTPGTVCVTCHQYLTPLEYQRSRFDDAGDYHFKNPQGIVIDDTDHGVVPSYQFKGEGIQAFATRAVKTDKFVRTVIQTHFVFYFGREMRWDKDERALYHKLWTKEEQNHENIKALIRTIMLSSDYLNGSVRPALYSSPKHQPEVHNPRTAGKRRRSKIG